MNLARIMLALAALGALQGCAAVPVAEAVGWAMAGASLGITAMHDCKADGGLPDCVNPYTPAGGKPKP